MSPFRITRRSLRAYIFLVIFASSFVVFTLTPSHSVVSTNLPTNFSIYLPRVYQAHRSAPTGSPWDLDSDTLYPEPPPQRPSHIFRPDGLLEVHPGGRHPILDLIEHAEKEWDAKLARASKTLPEAVREYHFRYSRAPPPGFDRWWAYVQKHNVQLPDEYDQINIDLAPFWGINPARLQEIQLAHEGHQHSYTIAKSTPSGPVHFGNESLPADEDTRKNLLVAANQLLDLIKVVEDELPLFRAVFSPHDNPNVFLTHDMRRKVVEAGEKGKSLDFQTQDPPPYIRGWMHACPLNSVARNPPPSPPSHTPKPRTFIHDHLLAMDPCAHPSHLAQHGQFLSHGPGPVAYPFPIPQFSYCSSPLHSDIRVPIMLSWVDDVEGVEEGDLEEAWMQKDEERLLWRGLNTGIHHGKDKPWKDSQRGRLMDLVSSSPPSSGLEKRSTAHPKTIDALVTDPSSPEGVTTQTFKKSIVNPAMMDVAFAGKPGQCEDEVCKEVEERWEWRRRMGFKEAVKYKYVLDVDGNGWSSRFKRLMTSNSVVFKSTVYPEWFTHRIAPWVHYVPIQVDYSDLYDSLLFFRGDPSGHGAHEDLAKKIASRGREWSMSFWRKEDMVAYLYRLFLEYARVMDSDRDSLNFELEEW
ncbi:glycosyl transferase family 90-domain-containing protein [Suillus plorans]|uniref:Glycosyl transferase family 90-domain-containing protein n=1 Tax=Suillus plorans TaxID=116603 RepID=A0A9P7IZB5_9AGAM|nr:glycosyl transferase family 90-domain-containing protein [Suillus plorans]KAG1797482.1 glycosyl transferase family 90-domain-containing protein [Suillus plorans]